MKKIVSNEIAFISKEVKKAFKKFYSFDSTVTKKDQFDIVTSIDKNIETHLINVIKAKYPNDNILSEEYNSKQQIIDRTWTIDPIDGTVNMSHKIKIFGIQLSLIQNNEVILSYIYFPFLGDEYYAEKGKGSYLNGKPILVDSNVSLDNAIISFGDYTHKDLNVASIQHKVIGELYPQIAKIRMFGTAALDFALVAGGSTAGCVVITKNLWDIMPGYLIAKEAGAILINLDGKEFKLGDNGLIACSNKLLSDLIIKYFKQ